MLAGILLLVTLAAPAYAKPLEQEHYSGTDAGSFQDCGLTIEYEVSFRGLFKLKSGRGGDPTPYLSDDYDWEGIQRNPANGKWFSERGNGAYKDLRITNLHGTVYRFVAQESGSPWRIQTSDGRTVVKDRGLLRYQFDVDTQGDADLSNDVFLDGPSLIADHGSHPLFHMTSEEFCELVNDLLG
jgi:hypothetical protein